MLRILAASAFFIFICWIIYMADAGQQNLLFDFSKAVPYGDKLGHLFLYGLLTLLVNTALCFRTINWSPLGLRLQLGASVVLLFALLEECSQIFFPERTLDLADIGADIMGIVLFSYLSIVYRDRSMLKKPSNTG